MRIKRKTRNIGAVISLASMADIAFLLLIFFVVTSSIGKSDTDSVILPEAETPPAEEAAEAFSLTVAAGGIIQHKNRTVSTEEIEEILGEAAEAGRFPAQVRIIGDKRLAYTEIAPVLRVLAREGVQQVVFLASRKQEGK